MYSINTDNNSLKIRLAILNTRGRPVIIQKHLKFRGTLLSDFLYASCSVYDLKSLRIAYLGVKCWFCVLVIYCCVMNDTKPW